eukprot:TRINITY_DN8133_c0_g1_i2.p1 TRINITY_DN8133_c0_g1~~TRINITY_DN8133_c0_g1_i2.p1  ORF type:complete len:143 (+),score=41.38 TRINITY_DN8133_c0_g1_i2:101-529(+)
MPPKSHFKEKQAKPRYSRSAASATRQKARADVEEKLRKYSKQSGDISSIWPPFKFKPMRKDLNRRTPPEEAYRWCGSMWGVLEDEYRSPKHIYRDPASSDTLSELGTWRKNPDLGLVWLQDVYNGTLEFKGLMTQRVSTDEE